MANANRNPNIPNLTTLELSDDECSLLKALVGHVGGLGGGETRTRVDSIFAALNELDDSDVLDVPTFGAVAVTEKSYSDLETDEERTDYAQLHVNLERAVYSLAVGLGLVEEG